MKKQLLFLLLCATISFNGWAQFSISFTSTLTTAVIGSTIQVDYKYTAPPAGGNIYCAIELQNGWTWVSQVVGQSLSPAPAGTDVTGSFFFTIPPGTTPTASLPMGQNYKINIKLSDSGWNNQTGDFPATEINFTPAMGVNDVNFATELSVYPNPVSQILKIDHIINLSNASFSILNSVGQIVKQSSSLNNGDIDVSNLNPGMYILSVNSNEGNKTTKFQKK